MFSANFEEISDYRKEIFSDLSEEVVSELFDKVDGIPRSVLLNPTSDPKYAIKNGLDI